jgi:hypothetical protein
VRGVIDRDAAAQELDDFAGGDRLIDVLAALVEAGLIEELPGLSGTRYGVRDGEND